MDVDDVDVDDVDDVGVVVGEDDESVNDSD